MALVRVKWALPINMKFSTQLEAVAPAAHRLSHPRQSELERGEADRLTNCNRPRDPMRPRSRLVRAPRRGQTAPRSLSPTLPFSPSLPASGYESLLGGSHVARFGYEIHVGGSAARIMRVMPVEWQPHVDVDVDFV